MQLYGTFEFLSVLLPNLVTVLGCAGSRSFQFLVAYGVQICLLKVSKYVGVKMFSVKFNLDFTWYLCVGFMV